MQKTSKKLIFPQLFRNCSELTRIIFLFSNYFIFLSTYKLNAEKMRKNPIFCLLFIKSPYGKTKMNYGFNIRFSFILTYL